MAIYIHLYHGRKTVTEDMDAWGASGPFFGPFENVQVTYSCWIPPLDKFFQHKSLKYVEDLIYYDGLYYGDMELFSDIGSSIPEDIDEAKSRVLEG